MTPSSMCQTRHMTSPNFFVADLSEHGDPYHTSDGYEIGTECQNAGLNGFALGALAGFQIRGRQYRKMHVK